jgi:hypothetical protein
MFLRNCVNLLSMSALTFWITTDLCWNISTQTSSLVTHVDEQHKLEEDKSQFTSSSAFISLLHVTGRVCKTHGRDEKRIRTLEGNRPLRKPRSRCENNIKIDLKEVACQGSGRILDLSGSGLGPVAGSFEHGNKPSDSIKGGEFLEQLNDYRLLKYSDPWSEFTFSVFLSASRVPI